MMRFALLLALALQVMGGTALAVNREVALAEKPAKLLSEYDLFSDLTRQVPATGMVPYDLITPLFTDYAVKMRFVSV